MRQQSRSGLSLVEVLIAMAILAIAIIALADLFLLSLRQNAVASEGTRMGALAQDKLEELYAMPYEELEGSAGPETVVSDTGFSRQQFSREWSVQDGPDLWCGGGTASPCSKLLVVRVEGAEPSPGSGYVGRRQRVILATIVSAPGGREVERN